MERTRKISETVILGDLALDIDCDAEGHPNTVAIFGVVNGRLDVDKLKLQLNAEELEQLAKVVSDLRRDLYDRRDVCAEHGYHDGKGEYGQCVKCHPKAAVVTDCFTPGEAA